MSFKFMSFMSVHKLLFLRKTVMCLSLSQRLEKTFTHESKYSEISLNTSAADS